MIKCSNGSYVIIIIIIIIIMCLEKEKKHCKTMSVFYWLNSQQFIWNSNHTTRLSKIVDIKAIACHLQEEEEEEEDDDDDDDDGDDDDGDDGDMTSGK